MAPPWRIRRWPRWPRRPRAGPCPRRLRPLAPARSNLPPARRLVIHVPHSPGEVSGPARAAGRGLASRLDRRSGAGNVGGWARPKSIVMSANSWRPTSRRCPRAGDPRQRRACRLPSVEKPLRACGLPPRQRRITLPAPSPPSCNIPQPGARTTVWLPGRHKGFGGGRSAESHDVFRLRSFLALSDVELDLLPFLQAAIAVAGDRAEVHEHVLATLDSNETVALVGVEPLHSALSHVPSPDVTIFEARVRVTRVGATACPKAWLGMPTAPAVKFRRRCHTYTNFDSNRA